MDSIKTLTIAAGALATVTGAVHASDAISSDEARAIVAEMLADAENRSSLIQGGHDRSELNISGFSQIRYQLQFRDSEGEPDDFESGFHIPRTELSFHGSIYDTIEYRVSARFNNSGSNADFELQNAYVRWNWDNGWGLQLGQYRLPVWREDFLDDNRQLAVEDSVVSNAFGPGFSQNIHIDYRTDNLTWYFAFGDGFGSANTDWTTDSTAGAFAPGESDYAFTTRLDFKLAGSWDQFNEFTSAPGSDAGALLGVALHWEGGDIDEATPVIGDDHYGGLAWIVDFMYKGDGWNFFAAYIGAYSDVDSLDDTTDHAFVAQGGFFIPDTDWELFARYDGIFPDGDRVGDESFNTGTLGANYYLHGHAAKFTFDVVWYFDATTENDIVSALVAGDTTQGLLPSNKDDQVALRAQFQIEF